MKILVLCYEYPPIGGGGGRVAKTVGEALAARGHELRVQTAGLGFSSRRETIGGVEVYRTASFRRAPDTCRVHEMGLYWMTSLLPTLRHIAQWRPDVIHAHFAMPTGLLAWQVHRLTGVPYVITAHLGDVPGGVPEQTDRLFRWIGPLARMVWSEAAACTAVSSFVQDLAERAYRRPVERILNGIDLSASPAESGPPGSPVQLVFIGRFNPQKRPLFLIDALSRVTTRDWKLTMIGDGPLMPDVRTRVAQYGLEAKIEIRGWQEAAEVHATLQRADLLCLPSTSEGMPVAAIEALAHGVAVATCDIPGVRDVLEPGVNGFASPVDDLTAYTTGLEALISTPAQLAACKKASLEKARIFDLSHIAASYERVLSTVVHPT